MKKKEESKQEERSFFYELAYMLFYLILILFVFFLLIHYVGQRTQVDGSSMNPTLYDGDNLIIEKITYRIHPPERFDVIVFPYKYEKNTYYVKRIIGLPGERVYIDREGMIYINGEVLEEHYGLEVMDNQGRASSEIQLGEDEYFVLGDNRNNSTDSRDPMVGNIKEEEIAGKVFYRIWPLSEIKKIS